jgi:hypothetical protein
MSKTMKMKVDNTGFLLDRMGKDCAPLQYIRELTQNAIEAIAKAGREEGVISWEADIARSPAGVAKLSITDNGIGMSGEEMIRYINTLSSSGARQALDGNYGVGAKITAATRNPAGLLYLSWKEGKPGEAIQMVRDPSGQYGLLSFSDGDESDFVAEVGDDQKPDAISSSGSGTRIVLMGTQADQDTCAPPVDAGTTAAQWVRRYLNMRYFRIPKNIKIQCQDNSSDGSGGRRPVTGQAPMLDAVALSHGELALDGAVARWWILPEPDAKFDTPIQLPGAPKQTTSMQTFNPGYQNRGHVAYLFNNELYDMCSGNAGYARLQQCGIIFGTDRVVIYMEPTSGDITTNTARTQLIVDSGPPPWTDWAHQFREKMPEALKDFVESFEAKRAPVDDSGIKDRIKEVLQLFSVPRYVPSSRGSVELDEDERDDARPPAGRTGGASRAERDEPARPRPPQAARGLKPKGAKGDRVNRDDLPRRVWKFAVDGTRARGEMEDKAAHYEAESNVLSINGDFRTFAAWIDYFAKQYPSIPGVREVVKQQVMIWWEQMLLEAVLAFQDFRRSPHWTDMHTLSDEALTMAVLPRYHFFNAFKRAIRTQLGKPEVESSDPLAVPSPVDDARAG